MAWYTSRWVEGWNWMKTLETYQTVKLMFPNLTISIYVHICSHMKIVDWRIMYQWIIVWSVNNVKFKCSPIKLSQGMIQSNSGEHGLFSSWLDRAMNWWSQSTAGWSWFVDIRGRVREEKNQQQSQDRAVRVQKSRVGQKQTGDYDIYVICITTSSNQNWMWIVL
jgi:hypothetical protein